MAWKRFKDEQPPPGRQFLAGYALRKMSGDPKEDGRLIWSGQIYSEWETVDDDYTHFLILPRPKDEG